MATHNSQSLADQLASIPVNTFAQNQKNQNQNQNHNPTQKIVVHNIRPEQNQNPANNYAPSKIGDEIEVGITESESEDDDENENSYTTNISVKESGFDIEDSYVEEDETEESVEETETKSETAYTVPFASQISQEVTFVVYPEELSTENLIPGFTYRNPFSRKGGTLRLLLDNLIPQLNLIGDQKILMLGDAKQATSALTPLYEQMNATAFNALLNFSSTESLQDSDLSNVGIPIDDRIYIQNGNVNLTFFSPYPDLQEDVGVKQIDNLTIWLSKLTLNNTKLNLVFAYTVQDLLDSSVNLVLNTLAQNEKLDSKVYLSRSHSFDLHPQLVDELTSSFDAFVCVTIEGVKTETALK